MTKIIKSISIPEPCSQQWQQMSPVDHGRHCETCCKTVTDFTRMTDSEIIKYFATKNNVCGRFTGEQLPRVNQSIQIFKPSRHFWKHLGIVAFVAGFFSTAKVDAQVRKIAHIRHTRLNIQKDSLSPYVRKDSLYVKALTSNDIGLDTRAKSPEVRDFVINVKLEPVSYLLGGVITGITIHEESRNSYMSIWDML